MPDIVWHYFPYVFIAVSILGIPQTVIHCLRDFREERSRSDRFVAFTGRVVEVRKRVVWSNSISGSGMSRETLYDVCCWYQVGQHTYNCWAESSLSRPRAIGHDTTIWLDPAEPERFALKRPLHGIVAVLAVLPLLLLPGFGVALGLFAIHLSSG